MVVASIATILLPRFSEQVQIDGMSDNVLSLWKSSVIKSTKILFPILIFSSCFSNLIMVCLYGNLYHSSGIYFMIKNLGGLFYIVPFAPILLSIGKSKEYANVHLIVALLCILLEFICVKLMNSPVLVAIVSELCQLLKIFVMMIIISSYSKRSFTELLPKDIARVLLVSLLAVVIPILFSRYFSVNKYLLLGICLAIYCVVYYILCYIFKVGYKDIIISLSPSVQKSRVVKFIP